MKYQTLASTVTAALLLGCMGAGCTGLREQPIKGDGGPRDGTVGTGGRGGGGGTVVVGTGGVPGGGTGGTGGTGDGGAGGGGRGGVGMPGTGGVVTASGGRGGNTADAGTDVAMGGRGSGGSGGSGSGGTIVGSGGRGSGGAGTGGRPGTGGNNCMAGQSCTPTDRCHEGESACPSGCTDTGRPVADGTNCGPATGSTMFCAAGVCGTCMQGGGCTPTNACKKPGTFDCTATGAPMCIDGGNQPMNTPCGAQSCSNATKTAARTCNASGACSAVSTTPCANPAACNAAGTDCLTCGSGLKACGTVCCGAGQDCCGGACHDLNTAQYCTSCTMNCTGTQTCTATGCKTLDGNPCTATSQCLSGICNTYYRDADQDGQGTSGTTTRICGSTVPSGYVTNADDCCDTNMLVKKMDPLAPPVYFTSAAPTCAKPFDYNCDGVEEKQFPDLALCIDEGYGCNLPTGTWWGTVPACGPNSSVLAGGACTTCCTDGTCLNAPTFNKPQPCR